MVNPNNSEKYIECTIQSRATTNPNDPRMTQLALDEMLKVAEKVGKVAIVDIKFVRQDVQALGVNANFIYRGMAI